MPTVIVTSNARGCTHMLFITLTRNLSPLEHAI